MVIQAYSGEKVYIMKSFKPPMEAAVFRINYSDPDFRMIKTSPHPER